MHGDETVGRELSLYLIEWLVEGYGAVQRATDLIVKARTTKGAETTDHYTMMGFTKAYNTAKKVCN